MARVHRTGLVCAGFAHLIPSLLGCGRHNKADGPHRRLPQTMNHGESRVTAVCSMAQRNRPIGLLMSDVFHRGVTIRTAAVTWSWIQDHVPQRLDIDRVRSYRYGGRPIPARQSAKWPGGTVAGRKTRNSPRASTSLNWQVSGRSSGRVILSEAKDLWSVGVETLRGTDPSLRSG